jgi:hypothetical protein
VALLVALAVTAVLSALAAQGAVAAPAAASCTAGQLSGKMRQGSGAAGTIAVSVAVRNISTQACTLRGFPRLKLLNAGGPLPTHVVHGGLAILQRPVTTITLAPGKRASLLVAYSDVPSGSETTCEHATKLVVILRHNRGHFSLPLNALACSHGRLFESPFLAGLVNV